ncbi:MAG TPA: RHS repeat-associated core domain-containing protein [Flavobacteriales bacterium]
MSPHVSIQLLWTAFCGLLLGHHAFAQRSGGVSSGSLTPKDVKASELEASVLSGDVDLFTGRYSASYPLGEVSTPGGLSFALSLNYSPTITGSLTPTVIEGLPYGAGWSDNIPTISVSSATRHAYTRSTEGAILNAEAPTSTLDDRDPFTEGEGFWYDPIVNIPGVASGRAVFRNFDERGDAVFVLNTFEEYVELRFHHGAWKVFAPNGWIYDFGASEVSQRMPSNNRTSTYGTMNAYLEDPENAGGAVRAGLINNIFPKNVVQTWRCTTISDGLHLPGQLIRFEYDRYGKFNFYKEIGQANYGQWLYNELYSLGEGDGNYYFGTPQGGIAMDSCHSDVHLRRVVAVSIGGAEEELRLNYRAKFTGTQGLLDPGIPNDAVEDHDGLYAKELIYEQGGETDFTGWGRFLHVKADAVDPVFPIDAHGVHRSDPYRTPDGQRVVQGVAAASQIAFGHGFLESPKVLNSLKPVPGDLYEIRTEVQGGYGTLLMGNLDINIVGMIGEDGHPAPNTLDILEEDWNDFRLWRRKTVFSTFDRAVKWHLNGRMTQDGKAVTSNFFMMPFLSGSTLGDHHGNDVLSYEGLCIQVGPANSDNNFSFGPREVCTAQEMGAMWVNEDQPGLKFLSAYRTYAHGIWKTRYPLDPSIGNADWGLLSHHPIPANFGVGLPWSMLLIPGRHLANAPDLELLDNNPMFDFWWNDDVCPDATLALQPNIPTLFGPNVYLKKVQLFRYGKMPLLLDEVVKHVRNGEVGGPDDTGWRMVARTVVEHTATVQPVFLYLDYHPADVPVPSDFVKNRFTLSAIRHAPVDPSATEPADLSAYAIGKMPATRFLYTPAEEYTLIAPQALPCLGALQRSANQFDQVWFGASLLSGIIDPMGRTTTVVYNDLRNRTLTHKRTLTGAGTTIMLADNGTPNDPCDDFTDYDGDASVAYTPSVKEIRRMDETGNEARTTTYTYEDKIFQPQRIAPPQHYRETGPAGGDPRYGFRKVTVHGAENGAGIRNRSVHEFHGQTAFQTTEVDLGVHGTMIWCHTPVWPAPGSNAEQEFLLFGKLQRSSQYDSQDRLLIRDQTDYAVSLAFENGTSRATSDLFGLPGCNDYLDYESGFFIEEQTDPLDHFGHMQTPYEGSAALEWHGLLFPPGPYHVALSPLLYNSYFIERKRTSHKEYDPNGCTAEGSTTTEPQYPDPVNKITDPHGTGYLNGTVMASAAATTLSSSLDTYGLTSNVRKELVKDPLTEFLLEKTIHVALPVDTARLDSVLRVQTALSNARLLQLVTGDGELSEQGMLGILLHQPYLSDTVQLAILASSMSDHGKASVMRQGQCSSKVLKGLLWPTPQLSEDELVETFRSQPVVPMDVLTQLIEDTTLPVGLRARILSAGPLPPLQALKSMAQDITPDKEVLLETMFGPDGIPMPDDVLAFVLASETLSKEALTTLILSLKRGPGPTVSGALTATAQELRIPDPGSWSSVIPGCTPCTTGTLVIETITDYEYYKAGHNGITDALAYKRLFGFPSDHEPFRLKWYPSWRLFSEQVSSPQYPGAYNRKEKYYYQDLRNRYDRHPSTISENDLLFSTQPLGPDPSTGVETWLVSGPYSEEGAYVQPPIQSIERIKEYNYRTPLVFQERTVSRNNLDDIPVAHNTFHYAFTRWPEIHPPDQVSLPFTNNAPCPYVGGPPPIGGGDDNGGAFPSPSPQVNGVYHLAHANNGNWEAVAETLPVGYALFLEIASGAYYMSPAPSGLEVGEEQNGWRLMHLAEGSGPGRDLVHALLLSKALQPRSNYVQADELTLTTWDEARYFNEEVPLLHFQERDDDDPATVNEWEPLLPYACIRTDSVLQRNMFQQPELVVDERGVLTRYNYDLVRYLYHYNTGDQCHNYASTILNAPGLPTSIVVGENMPDPRTTTYAYTPDLQVASVVDPHGVNVEHERDIFGRLSRTRRNGVLLSANDYAQWSNLPANDAHSFHTRTVANHVGSIQYLEAGSDAALYTRSYIDPLGRAFGTIAQACDVPDPSDPPGQTTSMVVSGKVEQDSWDRVLRAWKPFTLASGTPFDFKLTGTIVHPSPSLFSSALAEKDPRGRPLFEAKVGEEVASGDHRVKHRYSFLNGKMFRCQLRLSAAEAAWMMPEGPDNHVWRMEETEDEDGNISRSYANALGTLVATQAFSGPNTPLATLFFYDDQGRLTDVIDPAKRRTTSAYNLLGDLYSRTTPDGGTTRYMYDKSGNVVLEQSAVDRTGERLADRDRVVPTYRRYIHDHYNRLVRQERVRKMSSRYNDDQEDDDRFPGRGETNLLYFLPLDCDPPDPLRYGPSAAENDIYSCVFSSPVQFHSGLTLDWLAQADIHVNGAHRTVPCQDLLVAPITEKEWFYAAAWPYPDRLYSDVAAFSDHISTRLRATINYPHLSYTDAVPTAITGGPMPTNDEYSFAAIHDPDLFEFLSYNAEGLPATQIRQFSPEGITSYDRGLLVRLNYDAYDLRGNLRTLVVDVNADQQVDLKQTFTYDAWGHLRSVRAGFDAGPGELLATHDYDQALGLLERTKYFRDCSLGGVSTQVDEIEYQYDARDRLTDIAGLFQHERLYYDAGDPTSLAPVTGGHYWNGRINGRRTSFTLGVAENASEADLFTGPTVYGYRYDGLGRLTYADAVVHDAVIGISNPQDLHYTIGDERMVYDRVGNIGVLWRQGFAPSAGVARETLWYQYAAGRNRLMGIHGLFGTPDRSYTYDANGNLLSDTHRDMIRTDYGRAQLPWRISFDSPAIEAATYRYDVGDQRIYKRHTDANGTVQAAHYHLRDVTGRELGVLDLLSGQWEWYFHGTQRFARLAPQAELQPGFFGGDLGMKSSPERPLPLEFESLVTTLQRLVSDASPGPPPSGFDLVKYRMAGDTLFTYTDTVSFSLMDTTAMDSIVAFHVKDSETQFEVRTLSGKKPGIHVFSVQEILDIAQARMLGGGDGEAYTYPGNQYPQHLTFYEHDHLGNLGVAFTPDMKCTQPTEYELEHVLDYYPYGKILRQFVNDDGPEKHLTTQHERDQETGLDYRGARYYDSDVARFLSLDPLAADYASWSPYNYVLGDPIRLVDPDGRSAWKPDNQGNLIAEAGDNAQTLANYMGVSYEAALGTLKNQGFTTDEKGVLNLKVGDKLKTNGKNETPFPFAKSETYGEVTKAAKAELQLLGFAARQAASSTYKYRTSSPSLVGDAAAYSRFARNTQVAGAFLGTVDNTLQSLNAQADGDTNKALIDATQAGTFVVGAALLFTPAAPVGAVIIIIAGSSDLIQSAFDK